MTLTLRRYSPRLIAVLAAAALLWLSLRTVSWEDVAFRFGQVEALPFLAWMLANVAVLAILATRWWRILWALGYPLPFLRLLGYRLAAFGVSYFTPGSHFGGEPVQVYLVVRRHHVPTSASVASVTMDKLLELLANFTFLVVGVLYVLRREVLAEQVGAEAALYAVVLLAAPAAVLAALWAGRHPLSGALSGLGRLWPRLAFPRTQQLVQVSEEQVTWLCRHQPSVIAFAGIVSLLSWAALIGEYWLSAYLLGIRLSAAELVAALVAARIAILLPLPAGLGALEASQALVMQSLGYGAAAGISMALLIRMRDVTLGLLGLWIGGVSLWSPGVQERTDAELRRRSDMETPSGA